MPRDGDGDGTSHTRAAVAEHIATQIADLRRLARKHNFSTLDYFLDMARLEAEIVAYSEQGSEGRVS